MCRDAREATAQPSASLGRRTSINEVDDVGQRKEAKYHDRHGPINLDVRGFSGACDPHAWHFRFVASILGA